MLLDHISFLCSSRPTSHPSSDLCGFLPSDFQLGLAYGNLAETGGQKKSKLLIPPLLPTLSLQGYLEWAVLLSQSSLLSTGQQRSISQVSVAVPSPLLFQPGINRSVAASLGQGTSLVVPLHPHLISHPFKNKLSSQYPILNVPYLSSWDPD